MKKFFTIVAMGIIVCSFSSFAQVNVAGLNATPAFQPQVNLLTNIRGDKTNVSFVSISILFSPSQQAKDLIFIPQANN